jgi:hypothetical protein
MSFLHSQAGYVLWFQFAFSVWQFLRDAKFFRIPYIFIYNTFLLFSPFWGLPTVKTVYVLNAGSDEVFNSRFVDFIPLHCSRYRLLKTKLNTSVFKIKKNVFESDSYKDSLFDLLLEPGSVVVSGDDFDILVPGLYIFRRMKEDEIARSMKRSGAVKVLTARFFLDTTPRAVLNKNFLRLVSVIPLMLQAKKYPLESEMFSILLVFMDIFSYFFNSIWQNFKFLLYKNVKLLISFSKSERRRVFWHYFLSTVSKGFMYCDNEKKKSYYIKIRSLCFDKSSIFRTSDEFEIKEFERLNLALKMEGDMEWNLNGKKMSLSLRYEAGLNKSSGRLSHGNSSMSILLTYWQIMDVVSFFDFAEMNNIYICYSASERSIHLKSNELGIFKVASEALFYVEFKRDLKFFVSDHSISDEFQKGIVMSRLPFNDNISVAMFEHNREFFKGREGSIDSMFNVLSSRCGLKPPIWAKNSQWKRYISDLNILVCMAGEPEKRIVKCTQKRPSKTLLKVVESMNKSSNEGKMNFVCSDISANVIKGKKMMSKSSEKSIKYIVETKLKKLSKFLDKEKLEEKIQNYAESSLKNKGRDLNYYKCNKKSYKDALVYGKGLNLPEVNIIKKRTAFDEQFLKDFAQKSEAAIERIENPPEIEVEMVEVEVEKTTIINRLESPEMKKIIKESQKTWAKNIERKKQEFISAVKLKTKVRDDFNFGEAFNKIKSEGSYRISEKIKVMKPKEGEIKDSGVKFFLKAKEVSDRIKKEAMELNYLKKRTSEIKKDYILRSRNPEEDDLKGKSCLLSLKGGFFIRCFNLDKRIEMGGVHHKINEKDLLKKSGVQGVKTRVNFKGEIVSGIRNSLKKENKSNEIREMKDKERTWKLSRGMKTILLRYLINNSDKKDIEKIEKFLKRYTFESMGGTKVNN